ncbi:hypothetical protein B0H12DRAFT_46463, partial [Mycena haematopus]
FFYQKLRGSNKIYIARRKQILFATNPTHKPLPKSTLVQIVPNAKPTHPLQRSQCSRTHDPRTPLLDKKPGGQSRIPPGCPQNPPLPESQIPSCSYARHSFPRKPTPWRSHFAEMCQKSTLVPNRLYTAGANHDTHPLSTLSHRCAENSTLRKSGKSQKRQFVAVLPSKNRKRKRDGRRGQDQRKTGGARVPNR